MAIDQDVYCTLVMSDNYLPGAAILAHSLRDAGTKYQLAVIVTLEAVSAETVTELKSLYDYVIPVERIANPSPSNLYLMDRGDLLYAFTKINLWRLTQFRKIVYLDSDIVALRAPDELFEVGSAFAAAPDVGWPDAFNTGVMVLSPHMGTYWALQTLASSGDSFDGADQGLLNQYFEHKEWKRLSFAYNCTPSANYQYEPAYRYHKSNISMLHFIGSQKPWTMGRSSKSAIGVYGELLGRWWAVYDRYYKTPTAATTVPNHVRGEPINIAPVSREPEFPMNTAELSLTDLEDPVEEIVQGKVEPTPTVEQRRIINQMEWDATRAPPPSDAKPEAANFPTQTYEFNESTKLFEPPKEYPEPPKDMWYEVPKEKPLPPTFKPPPMFPWEEREQSRPTRVFAEDGPTPTSSETSKPPTPTIRVIPDDPMTALNQVNKNAWDEVSGIDQYVRQLSSMQRLRGKLQVLHETGQQPQLPNGEQPPAQKPRRESLILTDFPSAIERPSLPVTPAPMRRPNFWGEERDSLGALPQAEGVPDQAQWDPAEKLEELRRNSLVDPNINIAAKNVPRRDMPRSSVSVGSPSELPEHPHVHFTANPQTAIIEEAPSTSTAESAKPTFGNVDFAPAAPAEAQEDVLSPTEHGSRTFV